MNEWDIGPTCFESLFSVTSSLQSNYVVGETSELAWEVNMSALLKVTGQWERLPLLSTHDRALPHQEGGSITPQATFPSLTLGWVSTRSSPQ